MAAKKDFTGINTGRVYEEIEQATARKGQQGTASPQEQNARAEALKTQGRKGCKAMRINMAFTPSNYNFIKVLARATGRTMTEFANIIIQAYRNEHPEFMDQARHFLDYVNSGVFSDLPEEEETEGENPEINYTLIIQNGEESDGK